jgi:hypothetical protein
MKVMCWWNTLSEERACSQVIKSVVSVAGWSDFLFLL